MVKEKHGPSVHVVSVKSLVWWAADGNRALWRRATREKAFERVVAANGLHLLRETEEVFLLEELEDLEARRADLMERVEQVRRDVQVEQTS
ncbi:MAG: hypothetical protein R3F34_00825 [Planctomycetota bacterium]